METLTSVDMVALSRLDDIKVEKGRGNCITLRNLAKEFSSTAQEVEIMIERIDNAEISIKYTSYLIFNGIVFTNVTV